LNALGFTFRNFSQYAYEVKGKKIGKGIPVTGR
jgi:hypothetical protein